MSSDAGTNNGHGDWRYLRKEIVRRTVQPFSQVPFVVHFFVAIIVLGCLGIWVELIKFATSSPPPGYDGVLTALETFFPALIGSSSLQLILASTGNRDKVLGSFGSLVGVLAFAAVFLINFFHAKTPSITFWAAVLFAVFAAWLWWFTNGDDPTYKSIPVDAASGGDTNRQLKGDTDGFQE